MAERVDHAARQRAIALKATRLFSQMGYDNVTLSHIAESAGVARTILYRYFKDKREVFDAAIRAHTLELLASCQELGASKASVPDRLSAICSRVSEVLASRREFLTAVYDFVLTMTRHGEDMSGRIYEFTKGTRRLLNDLVSAGVADGSLVATTDVRQASDTLFGLLELCISRLVLGVETTAAPSCARFTGYIALLRAS